MPNLYIDYLRDSWKYWKKPWTYLEAGDLGAIPSSAANWLYDLRPQTFLSLSISPNLKTKDKIPATVPSYSHAP